MAITPLADIAVVVVERNASEREAILVELHGCHLRSGMTGGHGHCIAGCLQNFRSLIFEGTIGSLVGIQIGPGEELILPSINRLQTKCLGTPFCRRAAG